MLRGRCGGNHGAREAAFAVVVGLVSWDVQRAERERLTGLSFAVEGGKCHEQPNENYYVG